jgi:hypothetical protein
MSVAGRTEKLRWLDRASPLEKTIIKTRWVSGDKRPKTISRFFSQISKSDSISSKPLLADGVIRFNGLPNLKLQQAPISTPVLAGEALLATVCVHIQSFDQPVSVKLNVFYTLALQVFARIYRSSLQAEIECYPVIVETKVFRQPENVGVTRKKALHHVANRVRPDELTDGRRSIDSPCGKHWQNEFDPMGVGKRDIGLGEFD